MENEKTELEELKARLKAFALILRLGRDAFDQTDLKMTALHIVNDTRTLIPYLRSTLLRTDSGTPEILAQYARVEENHHSEHAERIRSLAKHLKCGEDPLEVSPENIGRLSLPSEAEKLFTELCGSDRRLLIVPLRSIRSPESGAHPFLWILEFEGLIPGSASAAVGLLSGDYGNSLWSHLLRRPGFWKNGSPLKKFSPLTLFLFLGFLFVLSLFAVRLEHDVAADFVTRPESVFHSYAMFDCVVRECLVEDGVRVKKGDRILEYDSDRMKFQLASAESACKEASAEYEQAALNAFTDPEKLGRVRILALKKEQAAIAVEEARWFLDHRTVESPVDGVVALSDGESVRLAGRALRTGEKQFDILGGDRMIAEIRINEKDASILRGTPNITLFLHTSPELPIPVSILSSRCYSELTDQNSYCYVIRAALLREIPGLRYGMRGVARVRGERVSLGYYLFRSLILWWRGV